MKCLGKSILILLLILSLGGNTSNAGESDSPKIVGVALYIDNGDLAIEVSSRNIFSERIIGTVKSGLPAVVEFFYHVSISGGETIVRDFESFSLGYDVWGDIYSVASEDTTVNFEHFEEWCGKVENLRINSLMPIKVLSRSVPYDLQISIAVNPLRGSDKKKIDSWVSNNIKSTGRDSWREQVLNLNELISHFFSSGGNDRGRSEWFWVRSFTLDKLPRHKGEGI